MTTIYYDRDADLGLIRSRRIAVIGYGNQGHAHALNLRDSGCEVRVGAAEGSRSWRAAQTDGFAVQGVADVCTWADLISVLLPDQIHKPVFEQSIRPALARRATGTGLDEDPANVTPLLMMAHGFSIHFGQVHPPGGADVTLVAPVGPGHMMHRLYRQGFGIPALLAVAQDVSGEAEQIALSYAAALGCTRAGVIRTTFQEETETDLFGEQAVLCGGLSALIRAGFDALVEAGYQPELAYFECVHQVKLIVDLIYEGGLASMHARISDTAEYGDYVSGPRIIDEHVREAMRQVLTDIQDGTFTRRWIDEWERGAPFLRETRARERDAQIEVTGARLRAMMSRQDGEDGLHAEYEKPVRAFGGAAEQIS